MPLSILYDENYQNYEKIRSGNAIHTLVFHSKCESLNNTNLIFQLEIMGLQSHNKDNGNMYIRKQSYHRSTVNSLQAQKHKQEIKKMKQFLKFPEEEISNIHYIKSLTNAGTH